MSGGTALSGYLIVGKTDVTHVWVPILLVLLLSFIVAKVLISVYEMAVSTTFLCFLEDEERNDGTPERPYYMSNGLLDFVNGCAEEEERRQHAKEKAKMGNKVVKF